MGEQLRSPTYKFGELAKSVQVSRALLEPQAPTGNRLFDFGIFPLGAMARDCALNTGSNLTDTSPP
jgi:hypothetical protein